MDDAIAYLWRHHRPGINQKLGACRAREMLLRNWVETVAVGTGSHPQDRLHAAVFFRRPRQESRIIRQQFPQTFDVVVMDATASFGYGPLKSPAQALLYFSNEILPAGKTIF